MEHGLPGIKLKKLKIRELMKETANLVLKIQSSIKIQRTHKILNLTLRRNLEIQKMMTARKS